MVRVAVLTLLRSLGGGIAASVVGMASFLGLHAAWILPIWFILIPGLAIAALGGLAVGWAYFEIEPRLPRSFLRVPSVAGALLVTLIPAQLLAVARGPLPLEVLVNLGPEDALRGLAELIATSASVSALLALGIRAPPRAVAACAVGGAAYAAGVGHNVPFITIPSAMVKMWAIMILVTAIAAIVLVASQRSSTPEDEIF